MARNEQVSGSSSIDSILRGLTDRPNVQSTLILARVDGSIIRATGFAEPNPDDVAQLPTPEVQTESVGGATQVAAAQQDGKPAEKLAAAIFSFVNNATNLSATLGTISRGASQPGVRRAVNGYGGSSRNAQQQADEDGDSMNGEDDVQLLRLRTKHQEIIIFPDPNYLCCVVQKKTALSSDRN